MPDLFMEDDPWFQEIAARIMERNRAKGKFEGKLEIISSIINLRFPDIAEEAQKKAQRIQKPERLDSLAEFIITTPDEKSFLWVLNTLSEM